MAARSYQSRVDDWLVACFGEAIARDRTERNHRFLEEAIELAQSAGFRFALTRNRDRSTDGETEIRT